MDDLPEDALLEILCRLPSDKHVSRCKCVSKRWCSIMSGPEFIRPFLQRDSNHMGRTLINRKGKEFLSRLSTETDALAPLFKRLMRLHGWKCECDKPVVLECDKPVVLGTYNDLVLCCVSQRYQHLKQHDYYICNARTYQWVSLPPPPSDYVQDIPVGFICDLPYYQCKEDEKGDKVIQVNSEYRGRVVRIIQNKDESLCEFKVEIFSTETWEWTQSIVSTPFRQSRLFRYDGISYPYNGVLYFSLDNNAPHYLIGLDPFLITDRTGTGNTPGDNYKCRIIQFDKYDGFDGPKCLGEYRGCLQICCLDLDNKVLFVWELNEEAISTGAGKFCLDQDKRVEYKLESEIFYNVYGWLSYDCVYVLGYDPNNDGTLYVSGSHWKDRMHDIFKYNKTTGEWSSIDENIILYHTHFYQLELPRWPTPVPKQPSEFQAAPHSG